MAAYVSGDFYSVFCTNYSVDMCQVILTIQQVVVKGYYECLFSVEVGERFVSTIWHQAQGHVITSVVSLATLNTYAAILTTVG